MWTLKLAAENSLCQLLVDPSLQILRLYSAASPGDFLVGYLLNLLFCDLYFFFFSSLRPLALSTRSSRPKSKDFLAFVRRALAFGKSKQIPYKTLHVTISYIATHTKNHQAKFKSPQRQLTNRTETIQDGSIRMNAIFKLPITLLTSI